MGTVPIRAAVFGGMFIVLTSSPGFSKDDKPKDKLRDLQQKLQQNQPKREQPKRDNKPQVGNSGGNDAGRALQNLQKQRGKDAPVQLMNMQKDNKDNPLRQRLEQVQKQQQQQPKLDQPKFQQPKLDPPKFQQPKFDPPKFVQPKQDQPKLQFPQGQPGGGKQPDLPKLGNNPALQPGKNPFNPGNQPGINPDLKNRLDGLKQKDGQPPFGNKPLPAGNQPGLSPELKKKLDGLKPKDGQPQLGNKPFNPGNQPGINPDLKNKLDGLKPKDGQPQFGNKPILPGNQPGINPDLKNKLDGLKPKDGQPQLGNKPILPGNTPDLKNRLDGLKPKDGQPQLGNNKRGDNAPNFGKGVDLSKHLKAETDKNPKLKQQLEALQGPKGRGDGKDFGGPLVPGDKNNPLAGGFDPKIDLKKGTVPVKIDRNNLLESIKRNQGKGDNPNLFVDVQKNRGPRNERDLQQMFAGLKGDPMFQRNDKFAGVNLDRVSGQFQNRLDRGDFQAARFNRFVAPQVQQRFAIDSQFALYRRGDVARQLNLNINLINGGGWRSRPIGPVFNNYTHHHFSSWYPGPSWCPQYCWTPQWQPWVSWSFWNWCVPIYDPRPFICRPYIYDPCPPIVIYEYPVWQPLPVVTCGTWVDIPPVVIDTGFDLELLAVRFIDPGHQEENLGPRYRVWLRNNSPAAIGAPFNVSLVAANGPQLAGELPQAGTTVPSIDANATVPVDIRLPLNANRLGRAADGTVVPFSHLHILVDSHRDVAENNEANNGAVLDRGEIYPVDPAGFSTDVTAASSGSMVSLAGEGFGPEPGQLLVTVNGETQAAEVHGWYDLGVNFKVPNFNLSQGADAQIIVVRGDSAVSNPVELDLAPQGWLQEAELPPAPVPGGGPVLPPAP